MAVRIYFVLVVYLIADTRVNGSCDTSVQEQSHGSWNSSEITENLTGTEICIFRIQSAAGNVTTVVDFKKPQNMDVFVFDGLDCFGHRIHPLGNRDAGRLILPQTGLTVVYIHSITEEARSPLEITWKPASATDMEEYGEIEVVAEDLKCEQLITRHCQRISVKSTAAKTGLCVFKFTAHIGMYLAVQAYPNAAQHALRVVSGSNCLGRTLKSEPAWNNRTGFRELGNVATALMNMDKERLISETEYVLYSEAKLLPWDDYWKNMKTKSDYESKLAIIAESGCQKEITRAYPGYGDNQEPSESETDTAGDEMTDTNPEVMGTTMPVVMVTHITKLTGPKRGKGLRNTQRKQCVPIDRQTRIPQ